MAELTITHTRAEGTLLHGSTRGDGVLEILRAVHGHWRPFRSLGCLGLTQSRDKGAKAWIIDRTAAKLREAGHTVTLNIDDAAPGRDVAEIEADRAQRAAARVERYDERAEKRSAQANADYGRAREMAAAIPFGQPMMPDHYSYGRDKRYRAKIESTFGRAFQGMDEAEELQRRANAAEANQRHRENIPATLRRIEKLKADARRFERAIAGRPDWVRDDTAEGGYRLQHVKPEGAHLARLNAELESLRQQVAYWTEHVKAAEAAGVKVWTPADFKRGDFVRHRWGWAEVLRVNAKSLTIPWGVDAVHLQVATRENVKHERSAGWTQTVTYDDITGRKSAEEMAEALASGEPLDAEQPEAQTA